MKIALLGAPQSGKTVYWSALYHEFQHQITLPPLLPKIKQHYKERNITKKVGFRIRISDENLEKELQIKSIMLDAKPIEEWPESTKQLNGSTTHVKFDFVPLDFNNQQSSYGRYVSSYEREIIVDDPPGGVFSGKHLEAQKIINRLKEADAAILFLPMNAILDAIDKDEIDQDSFDQFNVDATLKGATKLLEDIKNKHNYDDVFPCCFVISKSDECDVGSQLEKVEDFLYNEEYGLIRRISIDNPNMIICVCPISVVNPDTGNFKAMNLEWPFLFAAAATIFRNHFDLNQRADQDRGIAQDYEESAAGLGKIARMYSETAEDYARRRRELANRGFFGRLWRNVMHGERVSKYQNSENDLLGYASANMSKALEKSALATSYRNAAGRKIELANDDKQLALDTWHSLSAEGEYRRIRMLMAGEMIDNIVESIKGKMGV